MEQTSIRFIIPNLYENYEQNINFLRFMKDYPQYFIPGVEVSAVYGNFQFCIWDGGRIFNSYRHASIEDVKNITNSYNELGITTRLIFTSTQVSEKDYYNRFCNEILAVCQDKNTDIVINNEGLRQYIKTNYPSYNFISSTTKCITSTKDLKKELNNPEFKMTCLDYNVNKNYKFLESLNEQEKEKCEFLINAICNPACPYRKNHYRMNSIYYLNYGKEYKMEGCNITTNTLHPEMINGKNNITIDEIQNYYIPHSLNNFKMEGRTLPWFENLCNYVRYMVKPEYQLYILNALN